MTGSPEQVKRQCARIRQYVNTHIPVQALLRQMFDLDIAVGQTFRCPMHDDNRKSAKLYEDNAFWCFACQVQFSPYRILRDMGYDLDGIAQHIPPDFQPDFTSEIERAEQIKELKRLSQALRAQYRQNGDLVALTDAWIATFPTA